MVVAKPRADAWISLGGNQGDTRAVFREALERLDALPAVSLAGISSLYETPPWGDEAQPPFLNAVVRVATDLDAHDLLETLQSIETALGRQRDPGRPWGPRRIDLDLLLLGDQRLSGARLTLPHPRLHERAFVLVPLQELEPRLTIPGVGAVAQLLDPLDTRGIQVVSDPAWATSP